MIQREDTENSIIPADMEDFLNLAGVVCDIIMGQQCSFGSTSRTRRINDDIGLFICKVIRQGWRFCSFRPGILIDDELSDVSRQVLRFGMTVPIEQGAGDENMAF